MLDSIEATITDYSLRNLSPELQDELNGSLTIFEAFDYKKIYEAMPDVLFDTTSEDTDLTQSRFLGLFHESLDALLSVHSIGILNPADLHIKNQILSAMYRIQHIEDPGPILALTESSFSNEEKFAKIIDAYSTLDEGTILTSVDLIPDSFIKGLQDFLYAQENQQEAEAGEEGLISELQLITLKDLFTCFGTENLGGEMIANGIHPGNEAELYLPYIAGSFVTDDDLQSAKNILSFFCIASDTFTNPLAAYHQYSETLVPSHDRILKIEVKLGELLNELRHYQEANHVATAISAVQHHA